MTKHKRKNGLRVALVLSELRPGGMERVVVHLATGLAARHIPTIVVCLQKPGELAGALGESGARVEALYSLKGHDIRALWRLYALFREFNPGIINIHDYASVPYAITAGLMAGRIPRVFTGHGLLYEGFDRLQSRNRFFSCGFSALTAVSDPVAKRHRDYLNWSDGISVIQNGVPPVVRRERLRKAVRTEFGIDGQTMLFLAVGNPRPEKGFEDLIEAVVLMREKALSDRNFVVAIAGKMNDGPYCTMLRERVADLGLSSCCRLLGFRRDTTALYSAADVFVLSSRSEGLPMVILESMIAGLPVVATRVGGVPEVAEGRSILVDPGDVNQLAIALSRMIKEDGLAGRLGRAAQAHVQDAFGVDRMVADYVGFYERILSSKGSS